MTMPAVSSAQDAPRAQPMACKEFLGAEPFVWRQDTLSAARDAVARQEPAVMAAYWSLIAEADAALERGPYAVTDKERPPPSGDLKDYTSLAPYWWPDPSTRDGLPYVRRDGDVNPEREEVNFDRRRSESMAEDVTTLTLAGWFSGNADYTRHAADLLRVWFIDPATSMNPNLNYGQSIPGRTEGRDIGIIDTRVFVPVVDSIRLLDQMGALGADDRAALEAWFLEYARWLVQSPLGQGERARKNNHGTFFDMQMAAFAMFAGDCALPRQVFADTQMRIDSQITADGRMPLEEARTRSLHYYVFNTEAFLHVARLAEHFGVDLYTVEGEDGVGLVDTLSLLAAYAGRESQWPYEMIGSPADHDLWRLHRQANHVFNSPVLERAEREATGRDPADRIVLLTYTADP